MILTETGPTRREETRANTMNEIIRRGAEQVDAGGADQLSLNGIARQMRVSGPALYRYVATRDDLLTLIAVQGYADLGATLAAAVTATRRRRPARRLLAVGAAYRSWALGHPHRYQVMFADPRGSGGDPRGRSDIRAAAEPAMALFVGSLDGAAGIDADAVALRAWIRIHGVVSLELSGALDSMSLDGSSLLQAELELAFGGS